MSDLKQPDPGDPRREPVAGASRRKRPAKKSKAVKAGEGPPAPRDWTGTVPESKSPSGGAAPDPFKIG